MANRRRGEVEAILDGRPHTLCLTLGALAELETAFGVGDLSALVARFETGRLSASDLILVLRAALRGGGHDYAADEVGALAVEGGAAGAVALVADLLAVTFGAASPPAPSPAAARASSPPPGRPSPGTT